MKNFRKRRATDKAHVWSERALGVLNTIARSSLDALIAIDGDGNIIEFGPTAETLFGYARDEVMGVPVAEVIIPERLRQAHNDGMKHYHATGEGPVLNNRVEVVAVRRDGDEFEVELTVVPLELDDQKLFMAFVRDISERKRHEKELEEAREKAELASEAKSRFLSHMSHEIRSPLNAVLASVELLGDTGLDREQRRFVDTASTSGRALLGLINHILDFSRIEAGQHDIRLEPVNLYSVVTDTLEALRARAQEQEDLLVASIDPEVPATIETDRGVLRQVLTNLVDNAVKFTSQGVVGVVVSVADGDPGAGRWLRIEVADSGIGIPQEKVESLFQEFTQLDETHATRYDGTGLGLAIVQRLVGLVGGRIRASSEVGKGSRFVIELPATGAAARGLQLDNPGKVLVVTSQPLLAEVVSRQIRACGGEARTCGIEDLDGNGGADLDAAWVDGYGVFTQGAPLPAALERFAAGGTIRWLAAAPVLPRLIANAGVEEADTADPCADRDAALCGLRVLLVEDSLANQLVATAMLEKAGVEVTVAKDGGEGVALALELAPDLVLMDLRMPEVDGITATRRIRELDAPVARVPIVALTANAERSEIQRCLESGMNDYLTKPIDSDQLLKKVARWSPLAPAAGD